MAQIKSQLGFRSLCLIDRTNDEGLRLVIWSFFDESGKFADTEFINLCGYLSDERWDKFSSDWGVLLKQHNLPALHMADFFGRRPPYDNIEWEPQHQNAVLRQFVKVIRANAVAYFGVSLDAKYYRELPRESKKLFGEKQAEDWAFQRILDLVIKQLKQWSVDFPISTVFDYTEDFSVSCLKSLAKLRMKYPEIKHLIGSITFADSNCFYPLQAADMLAYGTLRKQRAVPPDYYEYLVTPTEDDPGPNPHSEYWDGPALDRLLKMIKEGTLQRL